MAGLLLRLVLALWPAVLHVQLLQAQPLVVAIESASAGFDQRTGEPVVSFRMKDASARAFGDLTRQNVGRPLAIRVDGRVLSRPVIREPIIGGAGQVTGNFTAEQARDLAARLQAGTARLEFEIVD